MIGLIEKISSALKINSNVLKVVLLLGAYIALLMVVSRFAFDGGPLQALFSSILSRSGALFFFTLLSLPALYFLLRWSKVIFFFWSPLDRVITALMTLIFAVGIYLLWVYSAWAFSFWGSSSVSLLVETPTRGLFPVSILLVAVFIILTVAYLNNFLFSLSATYEQKYEEANQEKVRAERLKSELITNVSHDIQTPLTSIINYSDLLRDLSRDDEQFDRKFEDYTEVLDRKSARLKDLTNDLIEASKAATGNMPVNLQSVNLTETVWQVAGEFDDFFNEKGLSLVLSPRDVQFAVEADSRHLWRILENLFRNMAKYSLGGTRVFAELEYVPGKTQVDTDGNMVKLTLKNVSAEPLEQTGDELVEQFMRGDKSRHSEGSGLGLYIAKSLTELMGGKLAVQVSGDQFEVSLWLRG
ncbi:MAG: HAMP domain-containing histidine kinase [Coriobacteriia bacterium]|nr:HAMP domain-containing histidine kinase [Coriobacteriia bacterium]